MEEKFNRCFIDKGGLYINPSEHIKSYVNFINDTLHNISKKWENTPTVYINFINSTILNAHATKFEEDYFIGINAGVIFLLEDIFLKIYSNRSLDIKNHNKINIAINNGINYNPYFFVDVISFKSEKDYYKALEHVTIVLEFLIYHELCHIYRGHVDYCQNAISLSSISEVTNSDDLPLINLLQTLEMDADSLATKSFYEVSEYLHQKDTLFSQEDYLYNYVYSLYCFFRIFGFYNIEVSKIKNSTHPPALIRISMIFDHIATIISELNKSQHQQDKIIDKIIQAIKDGENDICTITFFENQSSIFKEIYGSDEIKQYKLTIVKNWQKLKPDLEKYSFIYLPK